jgi:hypothetical protein
MRQAASTKGWRLLCVLLVRDCGVSPNADCTAMLWSRSRLAVGPAHINDWARGSRLLLIWCLPMLILLGSAAVGGPYLSILWPSLLTWMGAACLINAQRCRRLHCFLTGPYFLLLAVMALMHGFDVVSLGPHGWLILSAALVIGGPFLVYVPEWALGHYRSVPLQGQRGR